MSIELEVPEPEPLVRCAASECPRPRGFQVWFGVRTKGMPLCQVHRMWWAADNLDRITEDEKATWEKNNTHTAPDGETYTTWPLNFTTPVRPSQETLDKMQEMDTADRLKLQNERKKQLQDEAARRPGFGQDRFRR